MQIFSKKACKEVDNNIQNKEIITITKFPNNSNV